MQRVATFSRIVGNGNVDVIVNGVVDKEIQRVRQQELTALEQKNAELKWEREALKMIKKQRDRLLKEKYEPKRKKRILDHIKENLAFVFACILCWSEMLGLIEYIGDKKVR